MRLTAITIPWADLEEVTFDLRLGEVRKIQDKCGAGPAVILMRLQNDQWNIDDYREVILQGLLGGGKTAEEARKLVKNWVDERPARESLIPAQAILMAFMLGGPQGKTNAAETNNETTMAPVGSTSTQSMEPEPQSDSPPET